jgi:hypothetical protein
MYIVHRMNLKIKFELRNLLFKSENSYLNSENYLNLKLLFYFLNSNKNYSNLQIDISILN